jgi:quercetin dioxygenase-like cupin family protein
MKQLAIDDDLDGSEAPGYQFPGVRALGPCRSSLFAPPDFSLLMTRATLLEDTELHWSPHAGDEVVYILAGSVSTGNEMIPMGGVLLVEAGAPLHLQAAGETVLLHFGRQGNPAAPGRAESAESAGSGGGGGGRVHMVGPEGAYATSDPSRDTRFYAESDASFSATFFLTGRTGPYRSLPHSHSQDEIIYVASGGLTLGARPVPAGSAMAVPADRRYGFRGDDGGFTLLNYRAGPSYFSGSDGAPPFLEGGRATGMTRVGSADS